MKKQHLYRYAGLIVGTFLFLNFLSLPVYLTCCLLLIGFLVLLNRGSKKAFSHEQTFRQANPRIGYYLALALAGITSAFTLHNYWAAPTRLFKNADHHVTAHLGYSFTRILTLANEGAPQRALWDQKSGYLRIRNQERAGGFLLECEDFREPIYVQNGDRYTLANAPIEETFDSTLTVRFSRERQITLWVRYPDTGQASYRYQYAEADTAYPILDIPFNRIIRTGLSLRDLLSYNPDPAPGFAEVLSLLDNTYLLRELYLTKGNDQQNSSPLRLFPSRIWADSAVTLSLNGKVQPIENGSTQSIPLAAGQSFYTGLRTKRTRTYTLRQEDGHAALYLDFPEQHYLRSSEASEETLFLTSSGQQVTNSTLLSGLLFEGPKGEDNLNHLAANLSYLSGPTTEQMRFRVVNEAQERNLNPESASKVVSAGDTLRLASRGIASDPAFDVRWILTIRDLKATNGLPWLLLLAYVMGFTVLALLSVYLTPSAYLQSGMLVEVSLYIALLAFMLVRTILLWRASTFTPLEDITATEYNTLRDLSTYFWYQIYFTLGFFSLILGYKVWVLRLQKPLPSLTAIFTRLASGIFNLLSRILPQKIAGKLVSWLPWLTFLLYGLVTLKGIGSLERMMSVLTPVATYFLIDYIFQRRAVRQYGYATLSPEYRFVTLFNWLVAMAAFAVGDAGFAIIFLNFTLLFWYLRKETYPDHRLARQVPKDSLRKTISSYRLVLIPIALLLFISFSPRILSFAFRHLLISIELGLGLLVLLFWRDSFLSYRKKFAFIILFLAGMGLAYPFQAQLEEVARSKNRMLYRAEVRFRNPDEIIADEQFNVGNDRRLLNAAQNQWFINYFYDKGEFNLYRYFKRVPHFQQGSSYLTQISDLVSVRYVIAEHSEWVLVGLIMLLGLLTALAVRSDTPFHHFTKLRVQLLCFLFALSLTIWLTASDRMVFVGQDFPLLSLNSLLTLLMCFGALLLVVLAGYGTPSPAESRVGKNVFHARGSRQFLVRTGTLVLVFAIAQSFLNNRNTRNFDLSQTVARLEKTFDALNNSFVLYQREYLPAAGMSPTEVLREFDQYLQQENHPIFENRIFERSAYTTFKDRYVQLNSPGQLVHLRKNEEGLYEFAVNNFFYNINSPDIYHNTWQGHVVSSSIHKSLSLTGLASSSRQLALDTSGLIPDLTESLARKQLLQRHENLNIRLSLIPALWTRDSLPLILINRTQGEERQNRAHFLIRNGTETLSSNQIRHTVALRAGDILHLQSKDSDDRSLMSLRLSRNEQGYLAKNCWINGQPKHFYPLRERSLWSYYFTNLVKATYEKKPENWQRDVAITIDPTLTEKIYSRVDNYFKKATVSEKRGFSLVVLDSEGQIRALSDYKTDPNMRIDPNRMQDYKDLFRDLYLDPSSYNERHLFGNRCLVRMPNGPASTFKPILYSAITSQYDLGWSRLNYAGIRNYPKLPAGGSDYLIRHFGGRKMRLIVSPNNLDPHDNLTYLSQSTNTYNTMMVFLGSLTPKQIMTVDQGFRQGRASGYLVEGAHPDQPVYNFPLLEYDRRIYRLDRMPDWDENSSLLARGLSENFKLSLSAEAERDAKAIRERNLAPGLDDATLNASESAYRLWSFPEASHLFLVDRKENTQNAIPQIAMGAYPITVTPLKMAGMAASLFSFNANIHPRVLANATPETETFFSVGKNWQQNGRLLTFYSNNLFEAMHLAIEKGTATFLKAAKNNGYYFYAKTGTISGDRSSGEFRDKNLLLVISQQPLHLRTLTPETVRNNRFYVLYFSFYSDASLGGWSPKARQTVCDLIEMVQESDDFRYFMKKAPGAKAIENIPQFSYNTPLP